MNRFPSSICICGAGTMGTGIAELFSSHGFETTIFDADASALDRARQRVEKKIPDAKISYTCDLSDCVADLIIEAIIEDAGSKMILLNELAAVNDESTIFATNTSSLSVAGIAKGFNRPSRLAGMHFFNPAPVMKLVEVVRTPVCDDEVIKTILQIANQIGKTAVVCSDAPGFIVNHVARPYYLEALHLVESGITQPAVIDNIMESTGFRMGPFRLMDLIGNDINYSVSCIVYDALGKPLRLAPSALQHQKVVQGELGRKSGKGYYEYPTV